MITKINKIPLQAAFTAVVVAIASIHTLRADHAPRAVWADAIVDPRTPEHPHNMNWGGTDHRTLYLAAETGIYRIRLNIPGTGAFFK